jgi:hypothetical protein
MYFLRDVAITDFTINTCFFNEERPDLSKFTMNITMNVNFYKVLIQLCTQKINAPLFRK